MNWQSSKVKLPHLQARDQPGQRDLGRIGLRLNMLSPKKARPSFTP